MPGLEPLLRQFINQDATAPTLGPAGQLRTPRSAVLARDLARVSHSNRVYFMVAFGAVVVLFVIACVITLRFLDSPAKAAAVFAAVGITVTGLISQMAGLWKQKVAADLLIVLVSAADDELMKTMAGRVLDSMGK